MCWGENTNGELGNGETGVDQTSPQVVDLTGVWAIASGANHTCVRVDSFSTMCWGLNTHGQLGDGTNDSSDTPVEVLE
jgi:alpha-tubulin suppressor-like RCC1 family protein